MRLGLVLPIGDGLAANARAAEAHGLDVGLLEGDAPLIAAAMLAAPTEVLRLVAPVALDQHPVTIAEQAAVADLALGGRLVLALDDADAEALAEAVEIVLASFASRPFRHEGQRWRVPDVDGQRLTVTPAPAQLELPVWVGNKAVALEFGLTLLPGDAAHWQAVEARHGRAAGRLRRVAVRTLGADFDADALVEQLRADRDAWGLDLAIFRLPSDLGEAAFERAVRTLAAAVRPRVQLDRLPAGLETHWAEALR